EAYDSDREPSQSEVDEWADFYRSLGFLPEAHCVELATLASYFERYEFNCQLLAILSLGEGGFLETSEAQLWDMMRSNFLQKVLVSEEVTRRAKYTQVGASTLDVYRLLNEVWTRDSVINGTAAARTREIAAAAKAQSIPVDILKFLSDNLFVEACLDPLSADTVVSTIKSYRNNSDAETYITEVANAFEEGEPAFLKQLLHQVSSAVRESITPRVSPFQPVTPPVQTGVQ
ncbi:MAG TPA: hypothetical protein VLA04_01735, partial [Verrucomicrobiae bacterium]|nr:hypothetical protein [Verrucomicrobiae bacterium]